MIQAQLQVRSAYSLLASTNRIPELVQTAQKYGYASLAITDLNVLSGVAEFYQACEKAKIKPLIGLTLAYRQDTGEEEDCDLLLYAKNERGYRNLMKISTLKMEKPSHEPFYFNEFSDLLTNLVIIFSDETSIVAKYFQMQKRDDLDQVVQTLKAMTDQGSLFGGVSLQEEPPRKDSWLDFLTKEAIPSVALQEVRYLHPNDDFSLRVLEHIDEGSKLSTDAPQQSGPYYLPTIKGMEAQFTAHGFEDSLTNIGKVVDLCQFKMNFKQTLLPSYDVPVGETAASYLKKICLAFLPERIQNPSQAYFERLTMELDVIIEMGFSDYFLIIWDVMKFAAEQKIAMGPGRGSAAGSLVSFVTSITNVDPLEYNLLFERFLNKERYTMPDIDLDIPDNRRDEVLTYVNQKYGHHHVAQIATFGTMAAKMALRDVCRVFGLSQSEANKWSNSIPNVLKITLSDAYEQSSQLRQLVAESERNRLIYEVAHKIEGLPRHVSTHAAGVVISDQDLTQLVPLQAGSSEIPLTQFTMGAVEGIGLLKMDFLGLRNLSIIDDTLRQIRRLYNKEINLSQLPMNDEKTLALFRQARTSGVFQFESSGIRNVLRKLGPTSIEDVAAVNALYRPGPMDNIDLFVARKKGKEAVNYPHESLKEILEVTYGIIVYQEQIMQVVAKMAGFSYGQADILRRAISKKEKKVLDEQRANFVTGSLKQGYDLAVADEVYDYIERFANYGFNRSHAMAYSFIAYQMAYLKVHYPVPFFASLLNSVRHSPAKMKEYMVDAKRFDVTIKGPDINKSEYGFFLKKGEVIFGFSALKGVRKDFIRNILAVRKADGPFKSLDNFLLRIERKWLKEDNILPLIYIGAFDSLHQNRRQLIVDLDGLIKNIAYSGGSLDLLDILSLKKEEVADFSLEEKLEQEVDYLGTYLSGHPVDEYNALRLVKNARTLDQVEAGKKVSVLLYSRSIRIIRTKKGQQMAFVEGNDSTGELAVTLFPEVYRKIATTLTENQVYLIHGKVERSSYNQELQLLAESIAPAISFNDQIGKQVCYLKIPRHLEAHETLDKIKEVLRKFPGKNPVIVYDEQSAQTIALNDEDWIEVNPELKNELSYLVDSDNVVFK